MEKVEELSLIEKIGQLYYTKRIIKIIMKC